MVAIEQKVKLDPDVIITELDGKEAVLLHLGTKKYYTLNQTGLHIWQMLNKGLTIGEVSQNLREKFDVSAEKATQSVVNLVAEFAAEKLGTVYS